MVEEATFHPKPAGWAGASSVEGSRELSRQMAMLLRVPGGQVSAVVGDLREVHVALVW